MSRQKEIEYLATWSVFKCLANVWKTTENSKTQKYTFHEIIPHKKGWNHWKVGEGDVKWNEPEFIWKVMALVCFETAA